VFKVEKKWPGFLNRPVRRVFLSKTTTKNRPGGVFSAKSNPHFPTHKKPPLAKSSQLLIYRLGRYLLEGKI
jgi:hypothetical protein